MPSSVLPSGSAAELWPCSGALGDHDERKLRLPAQAYLYDVSTIAYPQVPTSMTMALSIMLICCCGRVPSRSLDLT